MSKRFWQKLPAVRVFIPFAAGIALEGTLHLPLFIPQLFFITGLTAVLVHRILSLKNKFQFFSVTGISFQLMLIAFGMIVCQANDVRTGSWFGHQLLSGSTLGAKLTESPVPKANSYKATCEIVAVNKKSTIGYAIVYFEKDSTVNETLSVGTSIIFKKALQEIRNSGNPGGFNYKQYCLFQKITHQVYLSKNEFVTGGTDEKLIASVIENIREFVLNTIRKYIKGKKEQGLAEALLIGYKNDLDRSLVQAYSNTGVVHVIAISGLHLGIIYSLLLFLTRPLNRKKLHWLRFFLILLGLWTFTLLAGAQASVTRSAVMFTFISASTVLQRTANVTNTMALSAVLLLAWNPYWLWDVGFQLSYTAVLSIIAFYKPLYNLFCCNSSLFDAVWKLIAVTISSQILTLPLTLYYFHQFPLLLLVTNLIAVPASTLILLLEIILLAITPVPEIATFLGIGITFLVNLLNTSIETANALPVVTWSGIFISSGQVALLYCAIIFGSLAALKLYRHGIHIAMSCIVGLMIIRSDSFRSAEQQKRLVVYNIARSGVSEIFIGRNAITVADSGLINDQMMTSLHLTPSRTFYRAESTSTFSKNICLTVNRKKLLFVKERGIPAIAGKANYLILSGDAQLPSTAEMIESCDMIVLDSSVPSWKRKRWKELVSNRDIHIYSVADEGAFVMDL